MKTATNLIIILGVTLGTALFTNKMREGEIPHRLSIPPVHVSRK